MKFPDTIIIELTNHCNLNCPLCSTTQAMTRERGYMEFGLYKQIIDELASINFAGGISFTMCGEPLLHPQIGDFVGLAEKNNIKTTISTNVTQLTKEKQQDILKNKPSTIILCVDGFSSETHEEYRVGSCFEEVKRKVVEFTARRNEQRLDGTKIIIQTLITSSNEKELRKIEEWAKEIGADEIHFKTLSLGTHLPSEQRDKYKYLVPTNPDFRREIVDSSRMCKRPSEQTIIYWNGEIGLCCIDFNHDFNIGNVRNSKLSEVLNSEAAQSIRLKGQKREHLLCQKCRAAEGSPGFRVNLKEKLIVKENL